MVKQEKSAREHTLDLKRRLSIKHDVLNSRTQWLLFYELPTKSGFDSQFVDAFAMNTFPSKKFKKIAYEIKVSRADLMKELKNPDKRKWAVDHSHQFYFVCLEHIVNVDEIPAECGLLIPQGEHGLTVVKNAPTRKSPMMLNESEMTVILKRAYLQNDMQKEVSLYIWQSADTLLTVPVFTQVLFKLKDGSLIGAIRKRNGHFYCIGSEQKIENLDNIIQFRIIVDIL